MPLWIILLVVSPVCVAIIAFSYLLFFDRDRLQSEDYQIRKQSLELIQEKGEPFPVNAPTIEAISNPEPPRLPDPASGGDNE